MKRLFFFVLMALCLAPTSLVAAEFGAFFKPGYMMEWTEKISNSKRDPFVEERGLLYSAGVNALFFPTENLSLKSETEFFWGQLDYKGSHLSDMSSYDTTGNRIGLTVEETASYKIRINESFSLSPFLALGGSYWEREICAEKWLTIYGRLGLQVEKGMFFGKAGLFLPFFTQDNGGFNNVSWINNGHEVKFSTNPKGVISPFAEIGIRYKRLAGSISYEIKKWERSDNANLGGGAYAFQPETTQQIISIKLEYLF